MSNHIFLCYNFHKDFSQNAITMLCKFCPILNVHKLDKTHDGGEDGGYFPFQRGNRLQFVGYVQCRHMHIDKWVKLWALDGKDIWGWFCGPHYSHETRHIAGESRVYGVVMPTIFSKSLPGLVKLRPVILTDGMSSKDALINFVQELRKLASFCADWGQQILDAVNFRL